MSAYEEYYAEKQAVDAYLIAGFTIVGINEVLDGMEIRFKKQPPDDPDEAELLLLTADARKYVSYLIFAQQKEA
ncbi:hypothetical protein [Cohnella sp.]|uniref:hypothetical protein n=1 Tax=Cohnella sp. TaxID=1883426 RepID=UPI003565EE06